MSNLKHEIERRRTFAIISHPDAGKTTLTEKFLLYGGAIAQAGVVKGKKNSRAATSDWMEIEKQRGISVTSSVMQFQYGGYCINILDTPGHQDFSEDTYRTLMAADSAVMVIDGAKGVEPQTRKLFKVCAMRHIPIFTFVNKMDREAKDPFDLLDELERELEARKEAYAAEKCAAVALTDMVPDLESKILFGYYVKRMDTTAIARKEKYQTSYVRRVKRDAEKLIEMLSPERVDGTLPAWYLKEKGGE